MLTEAQREILKKRTAWWLRIPRRDWTKDEKEVIDLGLIETAVVEGIPSWRITPAGRAALTEEQKK